MSKIAVVSSHLDDEVIGCGGTIARHVAEGDHVTVCVVANRSYDHAYDKTAIEAELSDCAAAKTVLGYQDFIFLNHPDERLDQSQIALIADLEKVINDAKPETVYIPWRGDTHQDHRATADAAMTACRACAGNSIRRIMACESPSMSSLHAPFVPYYYVSIVQYLETKKRAMACYSRESRAWPHPRSPEGIEVKARQRGMEVGLGAAEAFMVLRETV